MSRPQSTAQQQAEARRAAALEAYRRQVQEVTGREATVESQVRLAQAAAAVADAEGAAVRVRLRETWTDWSPKAVPHVLGSWTRRVFDESGMPEEQQVRAKCSVCGAEWQGRCSSGRVREHVQRFAQVHLHRNPFDGGKSR